MTELYASPWCSATWLGGSCPAESYRNLAPVYRGCFICQALLQPGRAPTRRGLRGRGPGQDVILPRRDAPLGRLEDVVSCLPSR